MLLLPPAAVQAGPAPPSRCPVLAACFPNPAVAELLGCCESTPRCLAASPGCRSLMGDKALLGLMRKKGEKR